MPTLNSSSVEAIEDETPVLDLLQLGKEGLLSGSAPSTESRWGSFENQNLRNLPNSEEPTCYICIKLQSDHFIISRELTPRQIPRLKVEG